MGVKFPIMRDGMYYGGIEASHANMILATRELKCVDNLKHKIFNFPIDLVIRSIDECKSIRDLIKEENIKYDIYIGEMRDYQTVGTAFMYASPKSIIGDGVGLGKTPEIAAMLNVLKEKGQLKRFLMAVETSAMGQTQYELMKFTGMYIITLPSEAAKMEKVINKTDWGKVDGIIIKHSALKSDMLSRWISLNLTDDGKCKLFDTFILDESSVIKNNETKTYKYTENICNLCDRIHFMNATTFETNIMDIYYQVDMMNSEILPKKWRIDKDYVDWKKETYWKTENGAPIMKYRRKIGAYKNQDKFKQSLKLVYFGRCKKDIGMDMPHIYKVYTVEPTKTQLDALAYGYRYQEVLNSPANIEDLKLANTRVNVPKIDRVCTLIENEFNDCQVMVYCFHTQAQTAIKKELEALGKTCCILNGQDKSSDKDANRMRMIAEFNSGKYDIIITNIKKSLNLNAADVCIMYSTEGNVAKLEQIRGRIDRNTDDRTKTFIMLLYANTDEYLLMTEKAKQRGIDSRELTIDAETAIDYFMKSMNEDDEDGEVVG